MSNLVKRAPVFKHSRVRFVVGSFDKNTHEGSICNGSISVISCIIPKNIFLHFVYYGRIFMTNILKYKTEQDTLIMMKVVEDQNNSIEKYCAKYMNACGSKLYVSKGNMVIRREIQWKKYSGRRKRLQDLLIFKVRHMFVQKDHFS